MALVCCKIGNPRLYRKICSYQQSSSNFLSMDVCYSRCRVKSLSRFQHQNVKELIKTVKELIKTAKALNNHVQTLTLSDQVKNIKNNPSNIASPTCA